MQNLDPSGRPRISASFGDGFRHYFLDVVRQPDATHFLAITRSDPDLTGKGFTRNRIVFYEQDLEDLVNGLTRVLGALTAGTAFNHQP